MRQEKMDLNLQWLRSVMNDEMTVEEWAQNVEDAFAQVRADMEAAN